MATKHDEESAGKKGSKGDDGGTTNAGIVSVAPSLDEQKAYFAEAEKVKEEVGEYEKAEQDELIEKMRESGQLPQVVNPDSKLPHIVHEKHGQIAPPNQNPTARCTVCGDPLAVGQNFVCRKHIRVG